MSNPALTLPRAVQIPNNYNTRHLGTLLTEDNLLTKPKLIRSGKTIDFTAEDKRILVEDYDLKTVFDFRTPQEAEDEPSLIDLPGVEYLNWTMFDEGVIDRTRIDQLDNIIRNAVTRDEDANELIQFYYYLGGTHQSVIDFYGDINLTIVAGETSQKVMRDFFNKLVEKPEGSVFFHCKGGKDRTGAVAAFYLRALGVDWETAYEDYRLTNDYYAPGLVDVLNEVLEITGDPDIVEGCRLICGVERNYLDIPVAWLNKEFGSTDNYLTQVLDLTEEKKQALRAIHLER